jgi:uncharacterized membrane protein YqiK
LELDNANATAVEGGQYVVVVVVVFMILMIVFSRTRFIFKSAIGEEIEFEAKDGQVNDVLSVFSL